MMQDLPEPRRGEDDASSASDDALAAREVRSEELFGEARVVLIRHAKDTYTLRRTSSGKLILTK